MKRLIIAAMCLAGGLALAQEDDEKQTKGPIEEMQIRLTAMEQINVTAITDDLRVQRGPKSRAHHIKHVSIRANHQDPCTGFLQLAANDTKVSIFQPPFLWQRLSLLYPHRTLCRPVLF